MNDKDPSLLELFLMFWALFVGTLIFLLIAGAIAWWIGVFFGWWHA